MIRLALVIFLTSISFGCGRKDDAQAKPASGPAPGSAPAATATPGSGTPAPGSDLATTKTLEPSMDVHNLVGNLQQEAANRPKTDITVEKVFDALEGVGITALKRKQYLAATAQAKFCAGGTSKDGIRVAVCEYADAAAAEAGKKAVEAEFGSKTPNTRRVIKGGTMLTITPLDGVAAQTELTEKAIAAFTKL